MRWALHTMRRAVPPNPGPAGASWSVPVGGEFGAARGNHKKEIPMSRLRRPPVIFIFSLFVLALVAVALGVVNAQSGSVRVPDNAHATGYGSGWECDRGYRQVKGACAAVKLPANAYLKNSTFGNGWECNWGYRQVDKSCVAIKVPLNAYLNSFGDSWKCDRGYRAHREACVVVKVSMNAHLNFSGNDWECNRPYKRQQEKCALPRRAK